jgi:pyruvate formate lyase activating enzyme
VPGLTDDPGEMYQVAEFAASLRVVNRVEILPFHQMGRYKWQDLGIEYTLAETQPPTAAGVAVAVGMFQAAGLDAS